MGNLNNLKQIEVHEVTETDSYEVINEGNLIWNF